MTDGNAGPRARSTEGEPYLDYGPPLAERYGLVAARAMARDPWSVFAHWEAPGAVAVRLRQIDGPAQVGRVSDLGSWYFSATPDREYEADLLDRGGRVIVTSNRVRTPRAGPAAVPAEGASEIFGRLAEEFRIRAEGSGHGRGKASHA